VSKGAENLIPFIIVGVILLVRFLKAAAAQQQRRGGYDGGNAPGEAEESDWEDWETVTVEEAVPQAPPKPTPSPKVAKILAALEEGKKATTPPPLEAAAQPGAGTGPASFTVAGVGTGLAAEAGMADVGAPRPGATPKPTRELMDESLAVAFPQAMKAVRALRPGTRRTIVVRAGSIRDLRQGILLSEVLGPPRAFDT
jgi:hypothetical protein